MYHINKSVPYCEGNSSYGQKAQNQASRINHVTVVPDPYTRLNTQATSHPNHVNNGCVILDLAVTPTLLPFRIAIPPMLSEDQGSIEGLATPFAHVSIWQ